MISYFIIISSIIVVLSHLKCWWFLLLFNGIYVSEVSYTTPIRHLEEDKVWSMISSLVVRVLWKARCKCVFQKVMLNEVELVKEIWFMLLHTLRGQYDAILGELDVVFHKQQYFREIWKKAEVFTFFGERIKWRYSPPRWLFPPPTLEGPCMTASTTRHVGWCG